MVLGLDLHVHETGTLAGGLGALGEHDRDDLPAVVDAVVLEDRQLGVRLVTEVLEATRTGVVDDRHHAVGGQGRGGVDAQHPTPRDGSADEPGGEVLGDALVGAVLDGVQGVAGDLERAVDAVVVGADGAQGALVEGTGGHRAASESRTRARAVMPVSIATL